MPEFYVETIHTYSVMRRWLVTAENEEQAETVAWEHDAARDDRMTDLTPGDFLTGEVRPAARKDAVDRRVMRMNRPRRRGQTSPVSLVPEPPAETEAAP